MDFVYDSLRLHTFGSAVLMCRFIGVNKKNFASILLRFNPNS